MISRAENWKQPSNLATSESVSQSVSRSAEEGEEFVNDYERKIDCEAMIGSVKAERCYQSSKQASRQAWEPKTAPGLSAIAAERPSDEAAILRTQNGMTAVENCLISESDETRPAEREDRLDFV